MTDEVGEKGYADADAARKHDILALSYAEVQERLAEGSDQDAADVLYSPLVPFGYSPHHMGRHLEVRRFTVEITNSDYPARA